jgi:hypothetical protein
MKYRAKYITAYTSKCVSSSAEKSRLVIYSSSLQQLIQDHGSGWGIQKRYQFKV